MGGQGRQPSDGRTRPCKQRCLRDVYGGVAIVNFVDLTWKAALTGDFLAFEPVAAQGQLVGLSWLVDRVGEGA